MSLLSVGLGIVRIMAGWLDLTTACNEMIKPKNCRFHIIKANWAHTQFLLLNMDTVGSDFFPK